MTRPLPNSDRLLLALLAVAGSGAAVPLTAATLTPVSIPGGLTLAWVTAASWVVAAVAGIAAWRLWNRRRPGVGTVIAFALWAWVWLAEAMRHTPPWASPPPTWVRVMQWSVGSASVAVVMFVAVPRLLRRRGDLDQIGVEVGRDSRSRR